MIRSEYRITLIYMITGALWILFSDRLLQLLFSDASSLRNIQLFQGWFFILITSLFLYFLLKYHFYKHINLKDAFIDSERKLRAIFDHHFQLTGLLDADGRVQAANKTALQFANVEESEIMGMFFWETPFWSKCQKKRIRNSFKKALNGEFIRFETYHPSSEGKRTIDFSFNPVKNEEGRVVYVIPEGRDITEIRRVEDNLKENEERLRSLSDNLPNGMTYQIDTGKKGDLRKLTYVSGGVKKLHGFTVEEVMQNNRLLYEQIHKDDFENFITLENEAIATRTSFTTEVRFKITPTKIRWHLITSAPRVASNGHIIWDGLDLDITKRKNIELEIENHKNHLEELVEERTQELKATNLALSISNEKLHSRNDKIRKQRTVLKKTLKELKKTQAELIQSEKMASVGVLTAGVCHEINNPLNFISGSFIGLQAALHEQNTSKTDVQSLLNIMKTGIDRATDIVKCMNQFSQSNVILNTKCDVHKIIENCLLMLKSQFNDKIIIEKNYTDLNCLINGNPGKLHQVFMNVLDNAIEAVKDIGTIAINTRVLNNNICIEIKDDGYGICKKDLPKVLDPFYTTKEVGQGAGLGLAIAYTLIKEHNGDIEVLSEKKNWTLIRVTLPMVD